MKLWKITYIVNNTLETYYVENEMSCIGYFKHTFLRFEKVYKSEKQDKQLQMMMKRLEERCFTVM